MGSSNSTEKKQKEEKERAEKHRTRVIKKLYDNMAGYLTDKISKLGVNSKVLVSYFPDKDVNYANMFTAEEIKQYNLGASNFCRQVCLILISKILDHACSNSNVSIYINFLALETIQYMWNMIINDDITKPVDDKDIGYFFKTIATSIGKVPFQWNLIQYKLVREIVVQANNLPGEKMVGLTKEKWNNIASNISRPVVRRSSNRNKIDDKSPPSYDAVPQKKNQSPDQSDCCNTQQDHPSAPDCHLVDQPPSYDVDQTKQDQPSAQNEST